MQTEGMSRPTKFAWAESVAAVAVCAVLAGYELWHNPIRFHQTASVDGYTLAVPVLWTPVKDPPRGVKLALRREWALSGTIDVMDRTRTSPKSGTWTTEAARAEQAGLEAAQTKDGRFNNPKLLDLNAGKFQAVCEEATVGGNLALTCYLVGTPLQFSYLGDISHEAEAKKMLNSLH